MDLENILLSILIHKYEFANDDVACPSKWLTIPSVQAISEIFQEDSDALEKGEIGYVASSFIWHFSIQTCVQSN